jgi:hypothetical protein
MALQNRVDPFGEIHAVSERGMFTGNRGVIHDPETRTLLGRRWTTRAWIICECQYKGFWREPMGRNSRSGGAGWTELFFLDEVTALAAGHRPCFLCRREKAGEFLRCFSEAFTRYKPRVPELDARLHGERLASGGKARAIDAGSLAELPDGVMFSDGPSAYAAKDGRVMPWSFAGYGAPIELRRFEGSKLLLITPFTAVWILREGYKPVWHATAQ